MLRPLLVLLLAALIASAAAPPAEVAKEVIALVEKLGSDDAAVHKAASVRLQRIGKPALAALRQAQKHTDPDVQLRALLLVRLIEKQATPITRDMILKGHTNQVHALDISRDGTLLVSGGYDKEAIVWDLKTGELLRRLDGIDRSVFDLSLSPDGTQVLAALQSGQVTLHDVLSGRRLKTYDEKVKSVQAVRFLPDGKRALLGHYGPDVRLFDVEKMRDVKSFVGHAAGQLCLAISPDGKIAMTGGRHTDPRALLWDVESGKVLHRLVGHRLAGISGCAFSPDGKLCATCSPEKTIRLWNTTTGRAVATIQTNHEISCLDWSPDGNTLATGEKGGTVTLWNAKTNKVQHILRHDETTVTKVRFTPDGQAVVSASRDRTVRVWKLPR